MTSRGALRYINPGTQLIDAAFPPDNWWLDFPGCGRYVSIPTNNSKNIKAAEIDRAAQLGHGFMWFVEQSENTPINNTTDDDKALADQAVQMALDLGVPAGTPFMFAVDTDGRPYMNQVRAAFVTYRQRVPEIFPVGAYAGSDIIDQLIDDGTISYGHIPAALFWSSTSRPVNNVDVFPIPGAPGHNYYRTPAAHMLQHPSEAYRGGRIDRNDVLRSMPVWYPGDPVHPPTPTPPTPGDTDMGIFNKFVQAPNDPAIWYTYDAVTRRHVLDFLDLRSTACQVGAISGDEAWGATPLSDDQIRERVVAPLGAPEHLRYFGVDVATLVDSPVTVETQQVNVTNAPPVDQDALAVRVRQEFTNNPPKW